MTVSAKHAPLLVWDIDDVLNRLMEHWLCGFAPAGVRGRRFTELTENPPCRIWDLPREEYLATLDRCRREMLYDQPPRPELQRFFQEYGDRFRHAVLSAVPLEFMEHSARWVLHWFGDWIQCTQFIPSDRPGRIQRSACFRSKAEALGLWGAGAVLIDDSPRNVAEVLSGGGRALLFPAPWNDNRGVEIDGFLQKIAQIKE